MKERLVQLLDLEQLTPSKFADIIGVQRSSVSHVISGRNKPSFDFLEKTLKAFPGLNAEWLILGKGTMYEKMGRGQPGTLFDTVSSEVQGTEDQDVETEDYPEQEKATPEEAVDRADEVTESGPEPEPEPEPEKSGRIVKVIVVYDDDTFSAYGPSL